ncbi:enoyl-CoA hydratase/isomerase family protein [Gordonia humi]|uniref:3-hydroxyisobutyryl-CoA hydrolase n=1 Tax=Gordonia humi TaxID=686429 RepID=A0A840F741_9ACTN|nr:enoyl-CoA hydratase/isomerase family protein [Gordonia humi]MBB4135357.1 enoyl-CoA hydratase [Gordonia humi]
MSYIRTAVQNGIGEIVLDRPKALNALDQSMIDDLHDTLTAWGDDDAVDTVLVTSASDRAFCAGGDIRAVRDSAVAGDAAAVTKYFASEYRVNQLIAEYPKPYVALVDGAAMGGGLGISVHGEIRVVTEKALIAMPETAIGFVPDVGSSYFLPRLPTGVGMWLGLTGARLRGADAVAVGLATHFVPSDRIERVAETIRSGAGIAAALADHRDPVEATLPLRKIADYFGDTNVEGIVGGLRGAVGDEWAEEMLALLGAGSPTSLFATARLIELGESSSLAECLERELSTAEKITAHPDFAEGVRAVLVDKDRDPSFAPATIEEVSAASIADLVG